jgi:dissimilatory sulfite reductase related protein
MTETVYYNGKSFEVDEEGFLLDFNTFSPEWVDFVKEQEGISELTEEHHLVIDVLQDYYKKNGITPMLRILSKLTNFTQKKIFELFPSGPGKVACKMAGLPLPTGCV